MIKVNQVRLIIWEPSTSVPDFMPIPQADVETFHWVSEDLLVVLREKSESDSSSGHHERLYKM